MSSDELVLVPVHGTKPQLFGRQLLAPPTWARPQSTFRASLEAALPERPVFVEFTWSGANTANRSRAPGLAMWSVALHPDVNC
jgi:hypothetical protein